MIFLSFGSFFAGLAVLPTGKARIRHESRKSFLPLYTLFFSEDSFHFVDWSEMTFISHFLLGRESDCECRSSWLQEAVLSVVDVPD